MPELPLPLPTNRAFVVQLRAQPPGAPLSWDGRVEHVVSGQMPPAEAFWSLTMYDTDFFFVPNPLNRYELSQRNAFITNPDGSVDLYIQAESPGKDKEANWLPAPTSGPFNLTVRDYWPTEAVLGGTYKLPPVRKVQ